MPNIVPSNISIPAHLAARVGKSALSQALAGGIGGGAAYPRISIKGSRFRIVEGGNETVLDTVTLKVIIVGANPRLSKTYYEGTYSPDAEDTGPTCYSLGGVAPAADAKVPQNDLCATCPQNAWGSKKTAQGAEVKACADQKRLAVVAADDPSGPVYLLQVTPAALKGLNAYQRELSMRGISPEIVRTTVGFDTDASFPKLKFGFGGFISEEDLEAITPLFGSDSVKEVTGEDAGDQPAAVAPAKPAPARAVAPAPAPAPAPARATAIHSAPAEAVAQPAPAEPPRRGFGAKAAAAPAAAPAAPAPAPAPKRVAKAAAAAPAATSGASLADEISDLLGGIADDA